MEEEVKVGCARPTGGPVGEGPEAEIEDPGPNRVGKVWEVWKTDMAFD